MTTAPILIPIVILIFRWAVFAISAAVAVVYKVETETSSRHTVSKVY